MWRGSCFVSLEVLTYNGLQVQRQQQQGQLTQLQLLKQLLAQQATHGNATLLQVTYSSVFLSSLELRDTKVYEPQIRALLGTASHFCEVVAPPGKL